MSFLKSVITLYNPVNGAGFEMSRDMICLSSPTDTELQVDEASKLCLGRMSDMISEGDKNLIRTPHKTLSAGCGCNVPVPSRMLFDCCPAISLMAVNSTMYSGRSAIQRSETISELHTLWSR